MQPGFRILILALAAFRLAMALPVAPQDDAVQVAPRFDIGIWPLAGKEIKKILNNLGALWETLRQPYTKPKPDIVTVTTNNGTILLDMEKVEDLMRQKYNDHMNITKSPGVAKTGKQPDAKKGSEEGSEKVRREIPKNDLENFVPEESIKGIFGLRPINW